MIKNIFPFIFHCLRNYVIFIATEYNIRPPPFLGVICIALHYISFFNLIVFSQIRYGNSVLLVGVQKHLNISAMSLISSVLLSNFE